MEHERKPDLYFGKQPIYIKFMSVSRSTGEIREEHPKDVYDPARFDGFAKAFGYVRIKQDEINRDP